MVWDWELFFAPTQPVDVVRHPGKARAKTSLRTVDKVQCRHSKGSDLSALGSGVW
jgi:hypothetical protein